MSDAGDRIYTGRYRVMQYVSDALVLFACSTFAVEVGKQWAWGPFIAALLVVAVGVAANETITRRWLASIPANPEQRQRAASRRRLRNTVIVPAYVTFGIGCGLIAGSIPSYGPDVVLGVIFLVFSVLMPLVLLRWLKRRFARRGAMDNEAPGPS
ncbi:MAG: hypothetical protein JWR52_1787 [Marmoricola sp.]|nr:hypothetical protein [Marmoricola sp.]